MDGFNLHMGYEVVISIAHQETDPWVNIFFISPYITPLVQAMGIVEGPTG